MSRRGCLCLSNGRAGRVDNGTKKVPHYCSAVLPNSGGVISIFFCRDKFHMRVIDFFRQRLLFAATALLCHMQLSRVICILFRNKLDCGFVAILLLSAIRSVVCIFITFHSIVNL